jgi:phosphatidylserine decarboxylase
MIKDAYRFIIPNLLFAAASVWLGLYVVTLVFLVLAAFVAYFFRNPSRQIPGGENLVVSPADGKVVMIRSLPEGRSISIFLSIFNVHVTRVPITGKLEEFEYKRGKFKAAYDDDASRVNEQNILTIRTACGRVIVKQIAGFVARRVICWKRIGDHLKRGELFGLIRFGSRVDVILPEQVKILVKVGDRVRGGSSVIGEVL